MSDKPKTLGIMAMCNGPTFTEKAYYRQITLTGRKMGISVFVFSPRDVDFEKRSVIGYVYRDGAWQTRTLQLPQIIYDRCFIGPSYRNYKPFIEKLQNDPSITFMGHGLKDKWQVYQMIMKSPELNQWLPETSLFTIATLSEFLNQYRAVVIKPMSGTHGRGVVRIVHVNNHFSVMGRNRQNIPFRKRFKTRQDMQKFVRLFTAGSKYLVQPYLSLRTPDGTPYDVRVLVQKNGMGKWQVTGKAVRLGSKESITSNLHGGGKAMPFSTFLHQHFSAEKRLQIDAEVNALIEQLPPYIESSHGPLFELGIDVGVDRKGKVWLIEVNSRPGRDVFRYFDDKTVRHRSMLQPVKYANYLMKERVGGY